MTESTTSMVGLPSLDLIRWCAKMCKAAYDEEYIFPANTSVEVIDIPENKGRALWITVAGDDNVYIAFRGTVMNDQNVTDDLKFWPVKDPELGLMVHKGFLEHINEAWWLLKDRMTGANKRFVIMGHSLGGAVGVGVGAKAANSGVVIDRTITFGQPRLGSKAFGERFAGRLHLTRVVHEKDIVPLIPTTVGISGLISLLFFIGFNPKNLLNSDGIVYKHFGELLHLSGGKLQHHDVDVLKFPWRRLLSDGWRMALKTGVKTLASDSKDHGIAKYIDALEELAA